MSHWLFSNVESGVECSNPIIIRLAFFLVSSRHLEAFLGALLPSTILQAYKRHSEDSEFLMNSVPGTGGKDQILISYYTTGPYCERTQEVLKEWVGYGLNNHSQ